MVLVVAAERKVPGLSHAAKLAGPWTMTWRQAPGVELDREALTRVLRPQEWQALERRDVDRQWGILNVRRTVSSGEVVELGKTTRSRRQVPLSPRALEALDALPARLDTPLLFPTLTGRVVRLPNFSADEWRPAIEASGVRRPARIYDLRCTFASNALAAGIAVFELAKVMGTSVAMIERSYGTLLDGSAIGIASRLGTFEAEQDRAAATFGPHSGRID